LLTRKIYKIIEAKFKKEVKQEIALPAEILRFFYKDTQI